MRRTLKNSWIGRVNRGEWCAAAGVVGLTFAIGTAIWRQTSMRWPFSAGAWFVAATAAVGIALVVYAYVSMRPVEPPIAPLHRGADGPGWRWTSSPTSAANTASAARIGFRVTIVESVDRKPWSSSSPATPSPARIDNSPRRVAANPPRSIEPDAWVEHLSAVGNTDFDDDPDEELDRLAQAAAARPTPIAPAGTVEVAPKVAKRPVKNAPIVGAPTTAKRPAGDQRVGAPPVHRRARREAMAAAAAPVSHAEEPAAGGDGLDDLAQRLLQGVAPARRRFDVPETASTGARSDTESRRITQGALRAFVCPEATRD